MKRLVLLSALFLSACQFSVNSSSEQSNANKQDMTETLDIPDNTNLQPGGCGKPLVLNTSGGRYILPVNNIDEINTWTGTHSHVNGTYVYINSQEDENVFQVIGNDALARFDQLLSKVCF